MNQSWDIHPILRAALIAVGLLAIAGLLAQWIRHRHRPEAIALSASSSPFEAETSSQAVVSPQAVVPPQAATPPHVSTNRILADCQPHLGDLSVSVPNIDVSNRPNPAVVQMKVRFWVNGDGFVTQVFETGSSVVASADQEAGLDYVRHLTFEVPNTEECRTQRMEMIGSFLESKDSSGEWATVFEVHPRYSLDGSRVVQSR
jgi:hypothetical protein